MIAPKKLKTFFKLNQSDDEEIGMSNQMCPENEIKFRVENNLIHRIEEGKFMIKEYRRSAADTNDLDSVSHFNFLIL